MAKHSGQYTRKVIVDKLIPAFESSAEEIVHENGRKYVVTLVLPRDRDTFLEYYDTQKYNQMGEGFLYQRSPLMYADPTENNHIYNLTVFKRIN